MSSTLYVRPLACCCVVSRSRFTHARVLRLSIQAEDEDDQGPGKKRKRVDEPGEVCRWR
jgi:hypothetical protein